MTLATRRLRGRPLNPDMAASLPIKILHLINGEYYAGAERVQDLIAINLPAHGYEVSFACLKPGIFPEARHCQKAPLFRLPMSSAFDLRRTRDLVRLIREQRFAVIHTHYTRSNLLGAIASTITGVPLVQHIHGVIGFDSDTIVKRYLNLMVEAIAMLPAQRIIVVSDHLRSTVMARGLVKKKLQVIHNGVPGTPSLAPRCLEDKKPVIGAVAFWRPGKGLEDLLRATHRLITAGQTLTLLVVGGFISPEYRKDIEAMAAGLGLSGAIQFWGATSEVNAALCEMDLFVLPSLSEGLPMVILEAMAAGVPVVATDVGGISEVIRSGTEGLLVPARDYEALAKAIQTLLGDSRLWEECRKTAWQRQKSAFSDQHMAAEVAKIYDQILAPGR